MNSDSTSQLADLLQQPSPRGIQKYLTMGRCSLLAAAMVPGFDLNGYKFNQEFYEFLRVKSPDELLFDCGHQFRTRLALIRAYRSGGDLRPAIRNMVSTTESAWQLSATKESAQLANTLSGEPGFLAAFDEKRGGKPGLGQYANVLREIAKEAELGWLNPGLQLAGEMLATLVGDHRRPECEASSVVMFAVDHPSFPHGILARLTIQRLPTGCGLLIPHPFYCGYLWMRESFSTGLQNALHAARGYASHLDWNPKGLNFDWRWRLDLLSATGKWNSKPAQVPIQGRSAEAAFACTMIATAAGNPDAHSGNSPLDPHMGATAALDTDSAEWRNAAFESIPLKTVESIKEKTLLGRADSERLSAVVVAIGQTEDSLPIDSRYEFLPTETLGGAYTAMVRFPRISRAVNKAIIAQAGKLLREKCDPYIPSAIEARVQRGEAGSDRAGLEPNVDRRFSEEQWQPLSRTEKSQLTTARLWTQPANRNSVSGAATDAVTDAATEDGPAAQSRLLSGSHRIWVCCESGLGKSMFILRCQIKVAKFGGGAVPIRVGRTGEDDHALSDIESWEKLGAAELVRFLVEFLDAAFPPREKNSLSHTECVAWMEWLLRNGQVVFLLDALDQSDRDMKDLSIFLSQKVPHCPAIVTGRLEAESNQDKAFRGTSKARWQTLRLADFDRRRQTRYLGSQLASELLPKQEELDWQSDDEEKRRHQWKDLLKAPLLLKLMKDLAKASGTDSLQHIHSRYDLYDRAVQYLIDQAPSKIEVASQRKLIEGEERKYLEEIAWFMMREHDVTNLLKGDRLAELKKEFKSRDVNLLDAVVRINLATLSQVIERTSSGIMAFRHRSFMEFFAGCYLATRTSAAERRKKLEEIHHMQDGECQFLPFAPAKANVNRPAVWLDALRFALSAATDEIRREFAVTMIELGNPWCIYHSIDRDKTKYDSPLDCLVRWLVHRDWNYDYDYRQALEREVVQPVTVDEARQALESSGLSCKAMLSRSTRDASWLSPLRELGWDIPGYYVGVSQESSLLEQMRCLSGGGSGATWNFLESFVKVRGGTFDICQRDYATKEQDSTRSSIEPRHVTIPDFALADFPVTNELFELFCPTYRRWRSPYSLKSDQPAIYVSWYMATEFCAWLSALTGQTYRLPTEWEWEWACRWLCGSEEKQRHTVYWWGEEMRDDLCWYDESSKESGTRGRGQAIAAFANVQAADRHPSWCSPLALGLLDMLGNVWEWCENRYDAEGSFRVGRGGGWLLGARLCRSGIRDGGSPVYRFVYLGFRVSLVPSSQARV